MAFVRDLQVGMTVPIDGIQATITKISRMDGRNGEPARFIGGGALKSALAIKIEFVGLPPIYAHPAEIIV